MDNDSKTCTICKIEKPVTAFMKRKDNYRNQCKECHNLRSIKYVRDNPEKRKESKRLSYIKNKDKIVIYSKQYYLDNKDMLIARGMDWEKRNPDKVAAKYNRWRVSHPERVREIKNRRRVRLQDNGSYFITDSFLQRLYSSPCVACGSTKKVTQDHVVPIARGGVHSEGNLQPLCLSCNSSKKDKLWVEWKYDS